MQQEVRQLVSEAVCLLGVGKPDFLSPDALLLDVPVDDSIYLIGLIGGKEVGKSSLVNALIGQSIVSPTGFGRGTSGVMAYVHVDQELALRTMLDAILPGQYNVVTHLNTNARHRVVLDLPDIDSIWSEHIEITRRLLKRILFPIWVQSVEKYADQQPLQLLQKVTAGNDPDNFLFVLSKVDQLAKRHGDVAVSELSNDYAARLQKACGLSQRPRVFGTSVVENHRFDLAQLISIVMDERSKQDITDARNRAMNQQDRTAIRWLQAQHLPDRFHELERLLDDAHGILTDRVGQYLMEESIPRALEDAGHRMAIAEPVARARLSRWPIVNVIDAVLSPVMSAVRLNVSSSDTSYLDTPGRPLSSRLRGAFSELCQRDPRVVSLYQTNKLWETEPAQFATDILLDKLTQLRHAQKAEAETRLAKKSFFVAIFAPFLTIGALLWFPIIQPILEIILQNDITSMSRQTILLIVQLLGATYLIKSIGFLAIYFIALWMFLRWNAYRSVDAMLKRWKKEDTQATAMSASGLTIQWMDEILNPIRQNMVQIEQLMNHVDRLNDSIGAEKSPLRIGA